MVRREFFPFIVGNLKSPWRLIRCFNCCIINIDKQHQRNVTSSDVMDESEGNVIICWSSTTNNRDSYCFPWQPMILVFSLYIKKSLSFLLWWRTVQGCCQQLWHKCFRVNILISCLWILLLAVKMFPVGCVTFAVCWPRPDIDTPLGVRHEKGLSPIVPGCEPGPDLQLNVVVGRHPPPGAHPLWTESQVCENRTLAQWAGNEVISSSHWTPIEQWGDCLHHYAE